VTIHVCGSDGQRIAEFEEQEFRDNLSEGRFAKDSYYWQEGMEDWRPVAEYRALAKTQRISFAPPMARTVRINIDAKPSSESSKPGGSLARWWQRLTSRKQPK
jgi:hypothetical protein